MARVSLAIDPFPYKVSNAFAVCSWHRFTDIIFGMPQCDASEHDLKPTSDWFFTKDTLGPVSDKELQPERQKRTKTRLEHSHKKI